MAELLRPLDALHTARHLPGDHLLRRRPRHGHPVPRPQGLRLRRRCRVVRLRQHHLCLLHRLQARRQGALRPSRHSADSRLVRHLPHRDDAELLPGHTPVAALHLRHQRHARGHRGLLRQLLRPQPPRAAPLRDPRAAHRRGLETAPAQHQRAVRQEARPDRPHDLREERHHRRALQDLVHHPVPSPQRHLPRRDHGARGAVRAHLPQDHPLGLHRPSRPAHRPHRGHVHGVEQIALVHHLDHLPRRPLRDAHYHRVPPRVHAPPGRVRGAHAGGDVPGPGRGPRQGVQQHPAPAPEAARRRGQVKRADRPLEATPGRARGRRRTR